MRHLAETSVLVLSRPRTGRTPWCPIAAVTDTMADARREREPTAMARTRGMPVSSDVRERLRAAQQAETEAIAAVQKALVAEAAARARLDQVFLRHQDQLSKAARAVHAAQAAVVRTSGLARAAALLDVSSTFLRSVVTEPAQAPRVPAPGDGTPVQPAPCTARLVRARPSTRSCRPCRGARCARPGSRSS